MSKHPTSELSPRDIACIEYGRKRESLMMIKFHTTPLFDYHLAWRHEALRDARAARERIFRSCCKCGNSDGTFCYIYSKEQREPIWPTEKACTCPHYKERRRAHE